MYSFTQGNCIRWLSSLLKSPIAPLPKYCSTEDEDLERFFSEFEDTLSKFNYPDYDKLLLLKQQISGRALTLVNSLEADKRGYVHAKELLLKAFASGDTQKFNVIHQLSELCLDKGDDPYEFISKVRLIIERVRKLNVDVDTIIQFFVWKGMNNQFKEHLIQITNNARPSLKQITDSFFEACDRFISKPKDLPNAKPTSKVAAVVSSEPSAASMAVNVKYNKQKSFKSCTLCSKLDGKDADHPIFKCNKFDTCQSKLEKLSNLNICVKCSNLNHESNTCHFKFNSRCRHCSGWHFSFLCNKGSDSKNTNVSDKPGVESGAVSTSKNSNNNTRSVPKSNKPSSNSNKETSSCTLNVTEAFPSDNFGDAILPTFTCFLGNRKIRGLKDTGCQTNLICSSIADELNLKVVQDDIVLTINGINKSQQYSTKLVEANLKFGDTVKSLHALCLPSININLKLPCLGQIVQGFTERGYVLADEHLTTDDKFISNIDFILRTGSSYCLPHSEHLFGLEGLSLYSQTSLGVLLSGDINQMLVDLPYLPHKDISFAFSNAGPIWTY